VPIGSFGDIDDNKLHYSVWRKTTATVATVNQWYDDSMLAGIPVANFYASSPLLAANLVAREGIRHWPSDGAADFDEHLLEVVAWGNAGTLEAPASYLLCDYLLYYPFLDGDSTDPQDLDNTDAALTRYTSGAGLRYFIVSQGAGTTTGAYSIEYTDQDGASQTATGAALTPTASAFLLTGGSGLANTQAPFGALATGSYGIRSVERFTWTSAPGGISAIVIVKPIAPFVFAQIGNASETTFYPPRMPIIHPDAYLGLLRCPNVATPASRVLSGLLTTLRS
jgi:hypothetical protein